MAKLTQVEQANILEKVLASHTRRAELEIWKDQLLEALKQVADLTEVEGMTMKDLRAMILEIRYNMRNGPIDPAQYNQDNPNA